MNFGYCRHTVAADVLIHRSRFVEIIFVYSHIGHCMVTVRCEFSIYCLFRSYFIRTCDPQLHTGPRHHRTNQCDEFWFNCESIGAHHTPWPPSQWKNCLLSRSCARDHYVSGGSNIKNIKIKLNSLSEHWVRCELNSSEQKQYLHARLRCMSFEVGGI